LWCALIALSSSLPEQNTFPFPLLVFFNSAEMSPDTSMRYEHDLIKNQDTYIAKNGQ